MVPFSTVRTPHRSGIVCDLEKFIHWHYGRSYNFCFSKSQECRWAGLVIIDINDDNSGLLLVLFIMNRRPFQEDSAGMFVFFV